MSGVDMGVATELGSFAFFVAAWVPMMAAMMLPGAVPAVSRFIRSDGHVLAALLFAGSYLAVWTVIGLGVYALYRPHGTFAAGVLTVAAGVYELTLAQARLPPALSRARPLGIRVRDLLRRLEHRADCGRERPGLVRAERGMRRFLNCQPAVCVRDEVAVLACKPLRSRRHEAKRGEFPRRRHEVPGPRPSSSSLLYTTLG
jgi:hypothetical protein